MDAGSISRRASGGTEMSQSAEVNRRRFRRVELPQNRWLACQAMGEGLHFDGEVSVISPGGLFIRSPKVQHVGARLGIKMRNIMDVVEADCVVRNHQDDGFGVEFLDMRPTFQTNLERIIDRLRDPGP